MKITTLPIQGMHCQSCELLIEDELTEVPGVVRAEVSQKKACAVIHYQGKGPSVGALEKAVVKAGYAVGVAQKKPWFSPTLDNSLDIFYSLFVLGVLIVFIKIFELDKLFATNASNPSNLITVAMIGITAGFSTCMALIGGLVLGVSSRYAEKNPAASDFDRFKPHISFNAGRIIGYSVFGGLIGFAGSLFQFSGFSLGIMTVGVALVMILMGLQLTNMFPRLEDIKLTLPSSLAKLFGLKNKQQQEYSHKNSFALGSLTFFLPCGFTQAMQLYAISTGNPLMGAAIMGVFAMGTAPGLLGVGGLTAVIKGEFAQKFFKFAGVVVIFLAFFNLQNGLNLIGWSPDFLSNLTRQVAATDETPLETDGTNQIIRMEQTTYGYTPSKLVVVKGMPVKWIITSSDPYSCAASILASKIGVRQNLKPGENIIQFTPSQTGTISFSCMMGMYRGSIEVVEKGQATTAKIQVAAANDTPPPQAGCGGGGGGCGGCGGGSVPVEDKNPTAANLVGNTQIIRTTYTATNDISPNSFTVSAGKPAKLIVDVKDDGVGCMSSIMISGLTRPQILTAGEVIELEFTPAAGKSYPITCSMGMSRGTIKVI